MIEWLPVDVLTCLETEPAIDEDGTSYRYAVRRGNLVLALEIWPYASDVLLGIRLADSDTPIVDLRMESCREIRYRQYDRTEELHFVGPDERREHVAGLWRDWQLQVSPAIQLKLGHAPS